MFSSNLVDATFNTDGKACMNGESFLKNYASKSVSSAAYDVLYDGCKALSLDDCSPYENLIFASYNYVCNTEMCNDVGNVIVACSGITLATYDSSKDTGYYKSSASALTVAGGVVVAMASLLS